LAGYGDLPRSQNSPVRVGIFEDRSCPSDCERSMLGIECMDVPIDAGASFAAHRKLSPKL
jgi:hypothetical protein